MDINRDLYDSLKEGGCRPLASAVLSLEPHLPAGSAVLLAQLEGRDVEPGDLPAGYLDAAKALAASHPWSTKGLHASTGAEAEQIIRWLGYEGMR